MNLNEKQLYQAIGKKIRGARENAKLTQSELAQRVELARTSITNIENGQQKIQVYTLYAIANVLNISVMNLLPEEKSIEERLSEELRYEEERDWILGILKDSEKDER